MKTLTWFSTWVFVTISIGIVWSALAETPSDNTIMVNISECDRKGKLAVEILKSRSVGETQEMNLTALEEAYKINRKTGMGLDYHVYIDYQRVIRDIFRTHNEQYIHANWTPEYVFKRERMYCLDTGF